MGYLAPLVPALPMLVPLLLGRIGSVGFALVEVALGHELIKLDVQCFGLVD